MAQRPRRVTAALILAGFGSLCFLGSAALYEEPGSFYTNFVLFPTLLLIAVGGLVNLVAIVLALTGLRGEGRKPALLALAIAVLVPALAIATIQLIRLYCPPPDISTVRSNLTPVEPSLTPVRLKSTTVRRHLSTVRSNLTPVEPSLTPVRLKSTTVRPHLSTVRLNMTPVESSLTPVRLKSTTVRLHLSTVRFRLTPVEWNLT